jgi:ubiquinone/menaquinone biosynthesis C-methylase UbiE
MLASLLYAFLGLLFLLSSVALFFFTLTRGVMLFRGAFGTPKDESSHVYPIYSNLRLIRLIDFQPLISAILLFQYDRLVSAITSRLQDADLADKRMLITSCAFGNVLPRLVTAAIESGAREVQIADIIRNELTHAQGKLKVFSERVQYLEENATALKLADGSVNANVIFFLLHELPHHLKVKALAEAVRVLAPGGQLLLAEFHRPDPWVLRAMSWTYFKVFEPLGLALWHTHDPLRILQDIGGLRCERRTVFFGNFQIIVATKSPLSRFP